MSIHKSIVQVFENNMGNRITPELAAGMVRSLIDILAAGVQQQAQADDAPQQDAGQQEGSHGMV
ncbi:hypothetical protein [Alcaligenes sp. SDU_A2]|uniref:hypothetical protein n=1 Tax=Alcaligenes sp. SDU_A2 TaxID=3136634 RepID=UPI00311D6348